MLGLEINVRAKCFYWITGLAFMIDEIVQASNELYDAKRWTSSISSLLLNPLFHQRVCLAPYEEKCMIINTSRSQTS